jgi:ribosomal protein S18 acetylase RimI-like enzyme
MEGRLSPNSIRRLFECAEENFVVHATHAARRLAGARFLRTSEFVLVDSSVASDAFNVACRLRLEPGTAGRRVREAIAFFLTGGRPYTFWLLPGCTPGNLAEILEEAGLTVEGHETAMWLDLSRSVPESPPPGLVIRQVTAGEDLMSFADVLGATSEPPDPQVSAFYAAAERTLLDPDSPQRLFLGLLDGRPVATSEVTVAGGVAGLYNVATAAAHRGLGIGKAMTNHCLAAARGLGVSDAVLQASREGERVYRGLGFVAIGRVTEFKPAGERSVPT